MNKLPAELLDNVVAYIPDSKLARYSTVSREWKVQIEARTFRKLTVRSEHIEKFMATVTGSRRRVLRDLCFNIELITLDVEINTMMVSRGVHDLFHALSTWSAGSDLRVIVDAALERELKKGWTLDPIVDLTSINDVPIVPVIRNFGFRHPVISDSNWLALALRLPNLEEVSVVIDDKRRQDLAQHRENRHKLAVGLNELNTDNLVHFYLHSRSFGWTRTFRPTANVLQPDRVDRLSLALNRIMRSPCLNSFKISGDVPISPALFDLPDGINTHFPFLEVIELDIAPCAPDGTRYFHGYPPVGVGEEEVSTTNYADNDYMMQRLSMQEESAHQFRWVAAAEALRPLVFAAARAVAHHHMPCLDGFQLRAYPLFNPADGEPTQGLIQYVAPGVSSPLIYGYPPCWSGADKDPSCVAPRTNIDMPGFAGDLEIAEAWMGVRKGGVLEWKWPEYPNVELE
ncbi:uncharacterized protein LTHEOB_6095 [Lasiodiplodia theobromae]|uniref:uncharacterized protein n=1 Tax=Lasiodiplodia theobromae TaxID=45133 RepID=UPI0015C34ACF|nr:uncharacterized protein LTHEOB_6095 [Lasiodiplodia theobromae]KAF4544525.1 hypothetical protein LTHEOB_6095 [Lasiodiplodia theobromae]